MLNFRKITYRKLVWLLPFTFMLHELEEWNITAWHSNFMNPPNTPASVFHILLVAISLFGFLLTGLAVLVKSERVTAHITLTFFILAVFTNSLTHIYWLFLFGVYAPGVITGGLLNIPLILLLSRFAVVNRLVSIKYLALLYMISAAGLIATISMGKTFNPKVIKGLEAVERVFQTLGWST